MLVTFSCLIAATGVAASMLLVPPQLRLWKAVVLRNLMLTAMQHWVFLHGEGEPARAMEAVLLRNLVLTAMQQWAGLHGKGEAQGP